MRHLILRSLAGAGVLLFGLAANAQQYPPRPAYQYQQESRDPNVMFDRIQRNLDRVLANAFPFSADRARITRAREEITEVQRAWNDGNLDRRALNDAIGSLQRVLEMNRLSDRNHDVVSFDLERLREFRNSQDY